MATPLKIIELHHTEEYEEFGKGGVDVESQGGINGRKKKNEKHRRAAGEGKAGPMG